MFPLMPMIKLMFFFASPSFLSGSSPPWAPFWSNRGSDLWDLEYLKALTKYVKRWTHPPALAKDLKFIVLHRRSFVISFQSLSASCKVNKFLKFGHVSCTYSRCHPCFHTSTASSMHYNSNHQNASAGVKVYKLRRAAPPASPRKPSVPNVSCFFTLSFLWAPSCFFWFVFVGQEFCCWLVLGRLNWLWPNALYIGGNTRSLSSVWPWLRDFCPTLPRRENVAKDFFNNILPCMIIIMYLPCLLDHQSIIYHLWKILESKQKRDPPKTRIATIVSFASSRCHPLWDMAICCCCCCC